MKCLLMIQRNFSFRCLVLIRSLNSFFKIMRIIMINYIWVCTVCIGLKDLKGLSLAFPFMMYYQSISICLLILISIFDNVILYALVQVFWWTSSVFWNLNWLLFPGRENSWMHNIFHATYLCHLIQFICSNQINSTRKTSKMWNVIRKMMKVSKKNSFSFCHVV